MKRNSFLMLFLATCTAIFSLSCSKDGNPGPAGQDGNANVVSSEWFVINPWAGVPRGFYYIKTAPAVTQAVIDSGVVLAYTKLAGGGGKVRPLPALIGSGATEYNFNFNLPQVGVIEFTCNLDGSVSNSSSFRYVVIPSSVIASSKFSKDAIRDMDMAEVEANFNLK